MLPAEWKYQGGYALGNQHKSIEVFAKQQTGHYTIKQGAVFAKKIFPLNSN